MTYVDSIGDQQDSIEMRYKDENIWLTQKIMATLYDAGLKVYVGARRECKEVAVLLIKFSVGFLACQGRVHGS